MGSKSEAATTKEMTAEGIETKDLFRDISFTALSASRLADSLRTWKETHIRIDAFEGFACDGFCLLGAGFNDRKKF